jgi:CubicO group peptidase (beta-lactamase class C family)
MLLSRSCGWLLACLLSLPTLAQTAPPMKAPLDVAAVDAMVARALKAFDVPGMAVAVVKDGQVVLSKGYGVSSLKTKAPVDANTLFGIASNTKAFTTAALGLLVDEGKLRWDDKVTKYIPEFQMYDPYVTAEFTVRDLLTHRSGLGQHVGDLMFFPDSSDFTVQDVIHSLRYFKPASSFRSQFDYDNSLYLVAGEVVARLAGQPWTHFVEARLLQPLGMRRSAAGFARLPDPTNVSDAHAPIEGRVQVVPRSRSALTGAAAGMYSSATDLSQWVRMLLGGPGAPAPLLKPATQHELWTPQTLIPVSLFPSSYPTHFAAYGLGWFLRDVRGYQEVWHTGAITGMVSKVTLLPELHLGIIVLTNQRSRDAYTAVTNQIEDYYLGLSGRDRVQELVEQAKTPIAADTQVKAAVWQQVAAAQKAAPKRPDYTPYLGRYHDAWFGDVTVYQQGTQLWWKAARSPRLVGQLLPYRGTTYVVRWKDRSFSSSTVDAFTAFALDAQGRAASLKMDQILSSPASVSYDFQDLDLQRVPETLVGK